MLQTVDVVACELPAGVENAGGLTEFRGLKELLVRLEHDDHVG